MRGMVVGEGGRSSGVLLYHNGNVLFAVNLNFLFRLHASEPQTRQGEKALAMSVHTLRMMAKGGIHDHVAKVTSFHVADYLLSFYCISLVGR